MLSARRCKEGSTSHRVETTHFERLRTLLTSALGEPKESKSVQSALLKELSNFHEYYEQRISELKHQTIKLHSHVEQLHKEAGEMAKRSGEKATQLEIVSKENEELLEMVAGVRGGYNSNKALASGMHSFYQTLNDSFKDRLRLVQSQYIQEVESLAQKNAEGIKERQGLQKVVERLTGENSAMRLQIREYEVEKRYEAERIKHATLELQIRLKQQQQHVARLRKQLERDTTARDITARHNTCRLSQIEKRDTMNDSAGGGVLISDPNCDSILNGSLVQQLKVTKRIGNYFGGWKENQLPLTTEKGKDSRKGKLVHKRNLSQQNGDILNLEDDRLRTSRDPKAKNSSELKIKVLRLQKMRRK